MAVVLLQVTSARWPGEAMEAPGRLLLRQTQAYRGPGIEGVGGNHTARFKLGELRTDPLCCAHTRRGSWTPTAVGA